MCASALGFLCDLLLQDASFQKQTKIRPGAHDFCRVLFGLRPNDPAVLLDHFAPDSAQI